MGKESLPNYRRQTSFRLNPLPKLLELAKYNPRLNLSHVELSDSDRDALHEKMKLNEDSGGEMNNA